MEVCELIELSFGVVSGVGPGIDVIDVGQHASRGRGHFWGFWPHWPIGFNGIFLTVMYSTRARKLDSISIRTIYRWNLRFIGFPKTHSSSELYNGCCTVCVFRVLRMVSWSWNCKAHAAVVRARSSRWRTESRTCCSSTFPRFSMLSRQVQSSIAVPFLLMFTFTSLVFMVSGNSVCELLVEWIVMKLLWFWRAGIRVCRAFWRSLLVDKKDRGPASDYSCLWAQ